MELVVFVIALVLAAAVGLFLLGRAPFPARGVPPGDRRVPDDARTAEPPGNVDDAG
jgi:hypothetical protein